MLDVYTLPVVFATLAVAIAVLFFRRNGNKNENRDGKPYPPSLPSLPIVGSLPFVSGGMEVMPEFFMKTAEKLGPVFTFYAGSRLAVVLNGKEAIADAMLKHGEAFADKPGLWTEAQIINKGLQGLAFANYNALFKKYHKLSLIILKELGFGANKVTDDRILQQVINVFDDFRRYNGRPFYPKPLIVQAVSNVIISVLFGQRFLTTGNGCHMIADTASALVENMDQSIDMAPLLRFLPMYRKKIANMVRYQEEMMKGIDKGVELNKSPDAEPSFVRSFLDDQGAEYDHQDLLYILRDICLGGSDTVVAVLLWFFVEMANHRDVQSRMQQEIDRVIPGSRYPSLDDKADLPYTEAVTLELLRRRTVSPLAIPHATLRDTTAFGYFIPGGSLVLMNIYSVHMDPKTWKDPDNFRPERFLDEKGNVVGKDRTIPFGVGRRSCVAEHLARQELFIFVTSLVQRFEILPPEGQNSVQVKRVGGLLYPPSYFEVLLIPRVDKSKSPE